MNTLERLKLTNLLKKTVDERNEESNTLKRLKLANQVQDLRKQLGLIVVGQNEPENNDEIAFSTDSENSYARVLLLNDMKKEINQNAKGDLRAFIKKMSSITSEPLDVSIAHCFYKYLSGNSKGYEDVTHLISLLTGHNIVKSRHDADSKKILQKMAEYVGIEYFDNKEVYGGDFYQFIDDLYNAFVAKESGQVEQKPTSVEQQDVNEFIDNVLAQNDPRGELELFPVSQKEVDIAKQHGLNIEGFMHVLDAQNLKHALKRHGKDGENPNNNQRSLTIDDLKRIPEVLKNFDELQVQKRGNNQSSLVYKKTFDDGRIECVERVIETSNKKNPRLVTKTAWVVSETGVISPSPSQVYTPDRLDESITKSNTNVNMNVNHSSFSPEFIHLLSDDDYSDGGLDDDEVLTSEYVQDLTFTEKQLLENKTAAFGRAMIAVDKIAKKNGWQVVFNDFNHTLSDSLFDNLDASKFDIFAQVSYQQDKTCRVSADKQGYCHVLKGASGGATVANQAIHYQNAVLLKVFYRFFDIDKDIETSDLSDKQKELLDKYQDALQELQKYNDEMQLSMQVHKVQEWDKVFNGAKNGNTDDLAFLVANAKDHSRMAATRKALGIFSNGELKLNSTVNQAKSEQLIREYFDDTNAKLVEIEAQQAKDEIAKQEAERQEKQAKDQALHGQIYQAFAGKSGVEIGRAKDQLYNKMIATKEFGEQTYKSFIENLIDNHGYKPVQNYSDRKRKMLYHIVDSEGSGYELNKTQHQYASWYYEQKQAQKPTSVEQNIENGKKAMQAVIDEQKDVKNAMYRDDIGWIDFVWGDVGEVKANGKTKGGKGIAHIIEARMRKDGMSDVQAIEFVKNDIVQALALGQSEVTSQKETSTKTMISYQGTIVHLVKNGNDNTWVLTEYEEYQTMNQVGGATNPDLRTINPIRSRTDVGASDEQSINEPNDNFNKQIIKGRKNSVKTAKGTKIDTVFALVDSKYVIASHTENGNENPKYDQSLQPRDRSRESSIAWVSKTANNLDPESLGRTGRADTGAPIIGDDMMVESGNGRTMAIKLAYKNGKADEYRQWLIDEADMFGFTEAQVSQFKEPILVRIRTTEIDRATFAIEANQDDKLSLSATERAKADAKRLDDNLMALFNPSDDGDLMANSNMPFIRGFLAKLGDTEASQYSDSNGKPTQALIARIKASIFAKAYDDDRLLEMMADVANPELQNMLNALSKSAPKFIEARVTAKGDTQDLSEKLVDGIELALDQKLKNAIIDASNLILAAKHNNQVLSEYVKQQGLFGDVEPEVVDLALFMAKNARSAKKMTEYFSAMAEYVAQDNLSRQNESLFGEPEPLKLADVMAFANHKLGLDVENGDLFSQNSPGDKQQENKPMNNDLTISELAKQKGDMPIDTVQAVHHATNFDEVRAIVAQLIDKPLLNEKLGFQATISKRTLDKMLSGKAKNKSFNLNRHLNAVANIDVLFAKAVVIHSEPEKNGDEQTLGVHKLGVKLLNDDTEMLVKITVKELLNDGNRIYSVEAIEENSVVPELIAPQNETNRLHNANENKIANNNEQVNSQPQNPNYTQDDIDYLNSIVNGTTDPLEVDFDRLIAIGEKDDTDPLFEQANDVISEALDKATQGE